MIRSDKSWPVLWSFCGLVMYILGRVSGSELVVKTVLGDTLYQTSLCLPLPSMIICCPWKSSSSFWVWPIIFPPPDTALWMFLIIFSLHSLIEQTHIGHPLCARHFREAMRTKLTLTSKKADAQKWHTHLVNWLWYMLDVRKGLQRVTKRGDW